MSEPGVPSLAEALEAAMMADLKAVNASGLTGEKNEHGPLWPPKERVNLYKTVADYLADKRGKTPASGEMGRALGGDTNG